MLYAKLVGGYIVTAKSEEESHDPQYKHVEFVDPPEAPYGYYYESGWEEQDEAIVQTWTLTPMPDDIDGAEAWEIIFGGSDE